MSPALLPVLPEHIFNDGQDMKTHPRNTEDVIGSGPFKLGEYVAGESVILADGHRDAGSDPRRGSPDRRVG